LITGAGQGIGRAVALRLAAAGAHIGIAEYNPQSAKQVAKEIETVGSQAMAYPVDIGDVDAVRQMVRDVAARFGHLDILVNNAGLCEIKPFLELEPKDWDRIARVNERGLFFCLQAAAR